MEQFAPVIGLLGGLALFLYGMTMMSNGLEVVAGNRMKSILEKLTTNRFLGVLIGALITALIQSSSATTVMLIGFVNSGLMRLENAVWVIMGANIGTTITGQLLALNITELAPLLAFIGVVMIVFVKKLRVDGLGLVMAGLGMLFMGMEMMTRSMEPLREFQPFLDLMTSFENPIIGIAAGALFTALIQSSSASVGILQALAVSGGISFSSAVYVLFGQNIGTCITAVFASIGADRNAKRTTILHLAFNIIGTIVFVAIALMFPFADMIESLFPTNVRAQIAQVHTFFNVGTTLLLLPFGEYLVKLAYLILPNTPEENDAPHKYLDFSIFENEYHLGTSTLATAQLFKEIQYMLDIVKDNVNKTFDLVHQYSEEAYKEIETNEEQIDKLNKEIMRFTTFTLSFELPLTGTQAIGMFLKVSSDLERIGDHAINIAERAKFLAERDRQFSDAALAEIAEMKIMAEKVLSELQIHDYAHFEGVVGRVQKIERQVDKAYEGFGKAQLVRLKAKECTVENSIQYAKILTDFERIGDYSYNIAKNFDEIQGSVQSMRILQ